MPRIIKRLQKWAGSDAGWQMIGALSGWGLFAAVAVILVVAAVQFDRSGSQRFSEGSEITGSIAGTPPVVGDDAVTRIEWELLIDEVADLRRAVARLRQRNRQLEDRITQFETTTALPPAAPLPAR